MAIGDGILTPAISVLSAVSGVQLKITELHENHIVLISGVVLVVLFSLQHYGTQSCLHVCSNCHSMASVH